MNWSSIRHFSRDEFGQSGTVEPDEALVKMLDEARTIAGVPFAINSGIRTPERNAEVGGKPDSAHLHGYAVDIRVRNSHERFRILFGLICAGFTRLGVANTFVHADVDEDKPQEVTWTYS